jgi:hypothetical protein
VEFQRVDIPTLPDERGSISVVHAGVETPFPIARVYFLHGVPAGAERGGHAHRRLLQAIIALSGSFVLRCHDGQSWGERELRDPSEAILIPPMTWRELKGFSSGAVCLVLASEPYDESDYIRDFDEFTSECRS